MKRRKDRLAPTKREKSNTVKLGYNGYGFNEFLVITNSWL